ncbi:L-lysine 2-3-aminomutase [Penicillium bovifimosum]|uniref:L-lysine 2-3-aminomutase n=1 Tax=Penicillium bovifimosum TaxID=126998 RepID=A0A9W9L098_9EURO|nr:L-lysine 2-3-aminomutase [Penicillium bovifimosum]KAJ5129545.1 L-lysine 2-3-aminomutase [Penicillium bovifimosum]
MPVSSVTACPTQYKATSPTTLSLRQTSAQLLIQLLVRYNYAHNNTPVWKTGLPVRSAVLKPHAGELVVGWVTTSESSLLYVFTFEPFPWFDV